VAATATYKERMHPIERALAALNANLQTLRGLLEGDRDRQELALALAEVERCDRTAVQELRRLL
jgi:hypothetical protein